MSLSCDEFDYPTTVIEYGAHGIVFRNAKKQKGAGITHAPRQSGNRLISD